jgi:hypothetical protein
MRPRGDRCRVWGSPYFLETAPGLPAAGQYPGPEVDRRLHLFDGEGDRGGRPGEPAGELPTARAGSDVGQGAFFVRAIGRVEKVSRDAALQLAVLVPRRPAPGRGSRRVLLQLV